ncbi:MAG: filamentous hemagglutinin N-terminal domain-containing protein [Oscillatoriales cyanobacterium RU_3_3]|nr:filamentous hemagglutinin N-terminal domain-containing protein [Oscillatoriales cyanobacterium RU_3_3]
MAYFLFLTVCFGLFPCRAIAQIIPDSTLGSESSRTVPDTINNLPSDRISGGAVRGSSLFHSFREFNINEGQGAYFENPQGISNIFTRVTGGNRSNILGTLGVLGNSNLFLINPKGIVFGQNARLDVRGSFLATSADSIVFNNGLEFSATNPQTAPLLTVNIPVGLRFRENPGAIVNASRITQNIQGRETPIGLAVPPGQTIALIGGNISLESGSVSAFSGNILLGSVTSPGLVSFGLNPGLTLNYENIQNFGNIELSGTATVLASGPGGGAIALKAGNVTLRDRSSLVSDTLGNTDGGGINIEAARFSLLDRSFVGSSTTSSGTGGSINIRTAENIELRGIGFENFRRLILDPAAAQKPPDVTASESSIITGTSGAGRAGDISIDTKQLTLRDGATILNPAFGTGDGGSVTIRAAESVEINASGLFTTTFNGGNAGSIAIETGRLSVTDGAIISPSTFGAGNSGNLLVKASDSVIAARERSDSPLTTALAANSIGGTGRAGNIEINTRSLRVEAGASISSSSGLTTARGVIPVGGPGGNITIDASESVEVIGTAPSARPSRSLIVAGTAGNGKGGDVTVNARRVIVRDGGGMGASTLGAGQGGTVTVSAEAVEVAGTTRDGIFPSVISTASGDLLYQTLFGVQPPSGAAGNLNITTARLSVRDGAAVSVESFGTGRAGNINAVTDSIALDNRGSIDGRTVSGAGANINLRSGDIQLRRGSRITTDAGAADGGNININSNTLVAIGRENSDITANARSAFGGRVNINVPNVLGFRAASREQVRNSLGLSDAEFAALQVSPTSLVATSDIAAISQSAGPALQGTVTFSSSGVNPTQGLVDLPQNVVNPEQLITANPCDRGTQSTFTATGKGGVPASPNDVLSSESTAFPWVESEESRQAETESRNQSAARVPEAEGRNRREELEDRNKADIPASVVPARGWAVNAKGEVILVGYNSGNAGDRSLLRQNSGCVLR